MTSLAVAQNLAKAGIFVFPCGPDKRPLLRWREFSTDDSAQLAQLWRENAVPAVDLAKSGIIVIDCDRHGGPDGVAAFLGLVDKHGLPKGVPVIETPSGGRHFVFLQPESSPLGNATGALPPGIDVRGHGGYVVASGAVLPDGRAWRQISGPELAEAFACGLVPTLPAWLDRIIRAPRRERAPLSSPHDHTRPKPYYAVALEREIGRVVVAPEGARNITLNQAAFSLGQLVGEGGLSESDVAGRLLDAAGYTGLDSDEATATIKSGLAAGKAKPRDRQPYPVADHPKQPPAETREAPASVAITPSRFLWRDPATIPMRQWLYGGHLIRKFVSCTVAAGGVGKSTLLLGEAIAMVTGRGILGHVPPEPLRVWVWNGEDPREEIERRVAAICLLHEIGPKEIGDRLFLDSGRELEIVLANMGRGGVCIATPVVEAVRSAIVAKNIDVLIIDPFVSSHRVTENDNGAIDAVTKAWAKIADATGCAIELVHHVRKTGGAEITAEDGRGAVSLIAAARSVRVLNVMSDEEARSAGVTEPRRTYFRGDNGKANLAPPPEKSEWFRIASQSLRNGPLMSGDHVGVVTRWDWPNALDGLSAADLRAVQVRLASGDHAANVQATNWAGRAIAEVLGFDIENPADKARVKSLLKSWLANKALRVETRHSARDGRDRPMIVVGACA